MHEEIFALAQAIVNPSEAETALLEALCSAAEAELSGRIQGDLTAEDCREAFLCAAAFTAAARMLPCRAGSGGEEFTVGDVSIRSGAGDLTDSAQALSFAAQRLMAPYRRDDGFAFLGVQG